MTLVLSGASRYAVRMPCLFNYINFHWVKGTFRLRSQIIIRHIADIAAARKRDDTAEYISRPHDALAFDDCNRVFALLQKCIICNAWLVSVPEAAVDP